MAIRHWLQNCIDSAKTIGLFFCCMWSIGYSPELFSFNSFITNMTDGTVSEINTSNNNVIGTFPVESGPIGIAITPDGKFAYVANNTDKTVSVINTSNGSTITNISLLMSADPQYVAITPDGKYAYVTSSSDNTVYIISTSSNTVISSFTDMTFNNPYGIAFTPDGRFVYIGQGSSGDITVFQVSDNTFVTVIDAPLSPSIANLIAITPDGKFAYVAEQLQQKKGPNTGYIYIIDTTSYIASYITIGIDALPYGVAINPNGEYLFVTDQFLGLVYVYAIADNTLVTTVTIPSSNLTGIAITPDGQFAYVVNQSGNTVSIIDIATLSLLDPVIPVGTGPIGIAFELPGSTLTGSKKKAIATFETYYYNKLSWEPVDNTSTYSIYQNGQLIDQTSSLTYNDEGVNKNQTYTYQVIAQLTNGTSFHVGTIIID